MGLLARQQEIIEVTKKLLTAITIPDYNTYESVQFSRSTRSDSSGSFMVCVEFCRREMSDPGLTSFEPESLGVLVRNMEFHRFLLENGNRLYFYGNKQQVLCLTPMQ